MFLKYNNLILSRSSHQVKNQQHHHILFNFFYYFLPPVPTSKSQLRVVIPFETINPSLAPQQSNTEAILLASLLLLLAEDEGETALAAVVTVLVGSHEHSGSAVLAGALATQALDFAIVIDL